MSATPRPDRFYLVTYGPVPRVTCTACDKSEHLPDEPGAYDRLKASHRCGERTSPWDSYGLTT